MSRKVGLKLVAVSTIAMAMGCNGAVDTDNEAALENEPSIAGNDDQDEQEAVEPSVDDLTIDGVSTTVSEPTNFKVSASTQTTVSTEWSAPSKGKPASYIVYAQGAARASTRNKKYTFSKLSCGTTYTLEVASRDAQKMISARSKISATTAACAPSTSPSNPSTPSNPTTPVGYAAAVLKDAPVSYWRLNETSGTRATDSAGANHGTFENGPKLGAQGLDGAVGFDGVDDVVTIADSADLRLNGSFTVEFMAKLGADANSFPGILGKGSAATGQTGYIVYYSSSRKSPAFKRAGVDGMSASDVGALATDSFKHYAFSYDDASSTARWYVGGNLDRTFSNVRFPLNLDSSTFQLGRGDSEGSQVQFGNEILDEVAVYKSALSADRVKAHFDASGLGSTPAPSNPAPSNPAPTNPVTPTVPVAPAPIDGFPIGVCAYKESDLGRLQAMGMHHARWDRPSAALIEKGRTMGIEILPIAAYGYADLSADGNAKSPPKPEHRAEWARRMVDMWRTMKNPPKVIEVWNEPWHKGFYGGKPNPADYLELVKAFS
ncbi:MAG: LamG-like jellyroll fold domain-containing protein, partial [Polyangiales bacterium]